MTGTILFTGANGSLAIPAVEYLRSRYPNFAVILTVRDDSDQNTNTVALRKVIARHPDINVSIRKLDLGSLKEAQSFSEALRSEIEEKKLPRIATIICNAMTWKLSGGPALTADGFESAMAINHLSQFAMVLRLLSAMDTQRGRVVFLGSEAHRPEKAGLSQGFPTKLLADLDALVHPPQDEKGKELDQGFRRYALSKLFIVMVAYELNRRLKEERMLRV
jgi:NAD(P)-dependent dehydrogenase (short-subunit alcohol dehydrogenase family)